ncbi:hypothetical protein HK100_002394 [Physocladia obscura]|uniref:Ubiquitin-like domain-containing protein n=1 Tax=Physocladia obscura TaxID=109957 RepID=A0AAD5XE87_9FUNG|nr:hypothetical protein HK100_002394 [Physocladia obscura]
MKVVLLDQTQQFFAQTDVSVKKSVEWLIWHINKVGIAANTPQREFLTVECLQIGKNKIILAEKTPQELYRARVDKYLNLAAMDFKNPVCIARVQIKYEEISVFVKSPAGKTLTFNSMTVSTPTVILKEMIEKRTGIPAEAIFLLFGGKRLEDSGYLNDALVKNLSTIHMALRLCGGHSMGSVFVDLASSVKPISVKFSISAPKWRSVSSGLNLHGFCINVDCDAFNEEV